MAKAAASAAVPKEAQFPPLDPEWHQAVKQRAAQKRARRDMPRERRNSPPSEPSGSGPVVTYDVRRPPLGPSSSSHQLPAPQRQRTRSPVLRSRSPSPERRRNDRSIRRRNLGLPWKESSDSSGSPARLEPPVQPARKNNQVEYAGRLLQGSVNLGPSVEKFMETIQRDMTLHSKTGNNRYLQEFYGTRKNVSSPKKHISTYNRTTVLEHALQEFSLENWKFVPVDLSQHYGIQHGYPSPRFRGRHSILLDC